MKRPMLIQYPVLFLFISLISFKGLTGNGEKMKSFNLVTDVSYLLIII